MLRNKEIYKHTSIISISIVIILIVNMILPMFTLADESDSFLGDIQCDESESKLTITGTLPDGYTSYDLYWAKGDLPEDLKAHSITGKEYIDKMKEWFTKEENTLGKSENNEKTTIDDSLKIEEGLEENVTYNVLCITKRETDETINYKCAYSSTKKIANEIKLDLSCEGKTIKINVLDPTYNIEEIWFAKSNKMLTKEEFESSGEKLEFEPSKEVNLSKTVDNGGKYYVYVENSAKCTTIASVLVEDENDKIEIQMLKLKDNDSKVYVNATSTRGNISTMKYLISDDKVEADTIKNDGVAFDAGEGIDITEEQKSKYISVYAEDEVGFWVTSTKNIEGLDVVDSLPWSSKEDENNPGEDENNPGEDENNPGEDENNPGEDENNPGEDENNPGEDENNPGEDENNPGEDENNPEEDDSIYVPVIDDNRDDKGDSNENNTDENYEEIYDEKDEKDVTQNESIKVDNEKSDNNIPQSGSNDTGTIVAIVVFSILGLASLVKYKITKE